MLSRVGTGQISRLNDQPWAFARVNFELQFNVLDQCTLAHPQSLWVTANAAGLIEVPLLVGGTYKMRLTDGQTRTFTVAAGTGSFCLWDAIVAPQPEDYPSFVHVAGDTMEGDLDLDGNAIANAKIGASNTIQLAIAPAGQRPLALEPGETMYGPSVGLLWVGTGESISYGVDGLQTTPAPPAGRGWREFSLLRDIPSQAEINAAVMAEIAAAIATNDVASGDHSHDLDELTASSLNPLQSYLEALEG